jgi:hypothetical protein
MDGVAADACSSPGTGASPDGTCEEDDAEGEAPGEVDGMDDRKDCSASADREVVARRCGPVQARII